MLNYDKMELFVYKEDKQYLEEIVCGYIFSRLWSCAKFSEAQRETEKSPISEMAFVFLHKRCELVEI